MTFYDIAAQAVGLAAMAFNILSFQCKTQKGVLGFQLFGSILFAVNYLMLGALVGGILNMVGIVRALVYLNKEKLRSDRPIFLCLFVAAFLASYVSTFTVFGKEPTAFHLVTELLPVIGMTAATVGFTLSDAAAVRRLGLIGSPCWLVYNLIAGSLGAILCEVLSLASILIGMLRLDRQK